MSIKNEAAPGGVFFCFSLGMNVVELLQSTCWMAYGFLDLFWGTHLEDHPFPPDLSVKTTRTKIMDRSNRHRSPMRLALPQLEDVCPSPRASDGQNHLTKAPSTSRRQHHFVLLFIRELSRDGKTVYASIHVDSHGPRTPWPHSHGRVAPRV